MTTGISDDVELLNMSQNTECDVEDSILDGSLDDSASSYMGLPQAPRKRHKSDGCCAILDWTASLVPPKCRKMVKIAHQLYKDGKG